MRILTKLILISICGFIISVFIFAFLIRPNLSQVGQSYDAGVTKQTTLKNLSEQIIAFKNSESDLNAVSNTDKILTSVLPRENLQVAIKEIETAALTSGAVEGMTIQEVVNQADAALVVPVIAGNPNAEEVPYTITVSGPFESLITLLSYMEHLPHFTEVTKISFGSTTTDTDLSGVAVHSGTLTGSINAVFFVQKPKP